MLHFWIIASITLSPLIIIPTEFLRRWILDNYVVNNTTQLPRLDRSSLLLNNIVEFTKD